MDAVGTHQSETFTDAAVVAVTNSQYVGDSLSAGALHVIAVDVVENSQCADVARISTCVGSAGDLHVSDVGAVESTQSRRSFAQRLTENVIVADAVGDSPSQKFTDAVVGAVEKPSARLELLYRNSDVFVVGAVGNPLSATLRDIFGHVRVVGAVDKPSERDAQ